jgi:hypothetical protein
MLSREVSLGLVRWSCVDKRVDKRRQQMLAVGHIDLGSVPSWMGWIITAAAVTISGLVYQRAATDSASGAARKVWAVSPAWHYGSDENWAAVTIYNGADEPSSGAPLTSWNGAGAPKRLPR